MSAVLRTIRDEGGPVVVLGDAPAADAWDALIATAAAPHPHFSRHVMDAHSASGLLPASVRYVTVRRGESLTALMPYRLSHNLTGLGSRVAQPYLSPFMTASPPLVAEGPDRAADRAALVEGLAMASGGRPWRWPLLPTEDGAVPEMLATMRARGWTIGTVAAFDRPVVDRRADHDAFLAGHPNRSRFKDLRRRARRLAEAGPVAYVTATGGADLARLVAAFLDLERSGWKGAAGTALACRPETVALAHNLFAQGTGPVGARADALTLDGRPIAISLALVASGTASLLKIAYDENLRSHAPGLLLEAEIVRSCHEVGFADRLDSATLEGSALESLYRERTRIAEIIAVPPGRHAHTLERRLALARFERQARATAKQVLRRR